ncbi:MAG: DEAD/DEAH box helicase [Pseudomonadota bacterium]
MGGPCLGLDLAPAASGPGPGSTRPWRADTDAALALAAALGVAPKPRPLRERPRLARLLAFAQAVQAAMVAGTGTGMSKGGADAAGRDEAALLADFARVGQAAAHSLGLVPHATQWCAARAMLDGHLVEMATGEGKTLAIGLAAAVAALGGSQVQVLTANDYLAARDAQTLRPMFDALGLTVATVRDGDVEAVRRSAYRAPVVYTTAREVAFDHLRDRRRLGPVHSALDVQLALDRGVQPVMTGLPLALLDEADSILLDEACTPLVLAEAAPAELPQAEAQQALALAARLQAGHDHLLGEGGQPPRLTPAGQRRLADLGPALPGRLQHPVYLAQRVTQALTALHGLQRDRDYVIKQDTVQIVDPHTGRLADGRQWSRGLHTLVEVKEGLPPTASQCTVATTTYPRFFQRYARLGGMSGTLGEAAGELQRTYRLRTLRVPLRLPSRAVTSAPRAYRSEADQLQAVTARVQALQQQGVPVLIGTGTVAQSQRFSAALAAAGVSHAVLNALQDTDEAQCIAQAGQCDAAGWGRVTVSTGMAGRGTDIRLGPGVAACGGLAVLLCALGSSRRADRQFAGRAARQGEPGRIETHVTAEDPLVLKNLPWIPKRWGKAVATPRAGACLLRLAQRLQERLDRSARHALRQHDDELSRALSFAGTSE